MNATYSPGQIAERSGFTLDTLRYYERIGLLHEIERTSGGQRRFREEDLEWLGVLRCLRDTGMPLAEMRHYAEQVRAGSHTLSERLELLLTHEVRVEQAIGELRDRREHLREKIAWYRTQLPDGQ